MGACPHVKPNLFWDIFLLILIVGGLLVLREVLCWLTKTNHIIDELRALRQARTGHLIRYA